tara:strand:+ start:1905 stop:2705 length:801 start_codon:yes stop_codon:yes gene_type:complete
MKKQKVTCHLAGYANFKGFENYSLGNQLFQVATTLSYAADNNLQAVFPAFNDPSKGDYFSGLFKNLNRDGDESFVEDTHQESKDFSFFKIPPMKNAKLMGYFQNERYFKHNRDLILRKINLSHEDKLYLAEKYPKLQNRKTVSCHLRRGDYGVLKHVYPSLYEEGYYERALDFFDEDHTVFVFSDDIDWCKENLKMDNVVFIHEKDYIDLTAMTMCEHNIIANSSFSWWGAWLNQSKNKRIIAPERWFHDGHCAGQQIVPKGWIKA